MRTKKTKPNYDSPWKEALDHYFPDFMFWMIKLPDVLELKLSLKINEIEETLKMPYITSIEAIGEARGEARGKEIGEVKGEAKTLLTLLKLKFGVLSDSVEQQIKTAEKNQLDIWVENILTAKSLESLLTTTP